MSAGWAGDPAEVAVIVPTLNAGCFLKPMIGALETQAIPPSSILVVDSGSRDATVERFSAFGAEVVGLDGRRFNHGGTRRYATELRPDAKFYILLTQDAIPADPDAFKALLRAFDDPRVGMAYGRQLPRQGSGAIERHARLYNYPSVSQIRELADRETLGVKAIFCSDSFAAYRSDALRAVGGFPEDCYFAEDQHIAAKMLMQGGKLAYCADARVTHSHGYTLAEDFRRCFDVGVWHRHDSWLTDEFGKAEGEGVRFIWSEFRYLLRHSPLDVPSSLVRTVAKYTGYRLGLKEAHFTPEQKKRLAMQSFYWAQKALDQKSA